MCVNWLLRLSLLSHLKHDVFRSFEKHRTSHIDSPVTRARDSVPAERETGRAREKEMGAKAVKGVNGGVRWWSYGRMNYHYVHQNKKWQTFTPVYSPLSLSLSLALSLSKVIYIRTAV